MISRIYCLVVSLLLGLSLAQTAVYPNYQSNREFWTLNGHTADPCVNREELFNFANVLGTTVATTSVFPYVRQDCTGPQLPDPSNTVLIPSASSLPDQGTTYSLTLTITGRSLMTSIGRLTIPGGDCSTGVDASLGNAVITAAANGASATFTIPAAWRADILELDVLPRKLCYGVITNPVTGAYTGVYTGFKIGVVWDCNPSTAETATKSCAIFTTQKLNPLALTLNLPLSPREQAIRAQRTFCARHYSGDRTGAAVTLQVGQCINPLTTVACQGAAIDPISMKCCDSNFTLVQWKQRPCFCRADGATSSPICPTGETCCTHTKYPELLKLHNSVGLAAWPQYFGECYNTTTHRCCDTGYRYDPGQDQCCNITGIQSLNVPCPCQNDADCQGGQSLSNQGYSVGVDNTQICCTQFWPDPYEIGDAIISKMGTRTAYPRCNKYANFPSTGTSNTLFPLGTGPYQAQRCLGICIDNRFQTCCNGVACRKEFELCCNSTCCNKFTSTCTEGRISGTPNNRFNYNELDQYYEICTSIEALNPIRGFWVFVWPAYLLLMTAVCTAFAIAFTSKVSRRSFSFLERAIIIIAFFTIIFACACYFAPIYKYGVWVTIVSLFAIITASARSKGLNIALAIVQFITILYLFDPFTGNNFLGFSSLRVVGGDPDPESAGILYSIQKMMHDLNTFNSQLYCHNYYNYFRKDPQLEDFRRDNLKVPSFGYCGHGWITALYIFEGITLILALTQFILAMIALILRYKEERSEVFIRLEPVAAEAAPVTSYYPAAPFVGSAAPVL